MRDALFFIMYTALFTVFVMVSSSHDQLTLHDFYLGNENSHARLGARLVYLI